MNRKPRGPENIEAGEKVTGAVLFIDAHSGALEPSSVGKAPSTTLRRGRGLQWLLTVLAWWPGVLALERNQEHRVGRNIDEACREADKVHRIRRAQSQ